MASLQAHIRKWRAEKDDRGRAILYVGSQSDLEHHVSHPQTIPAGDLLIRSRVPLGKDMQKLLDAVARTRGANTSVGIDAPPSVEVQKSLQEQATKALDLELASAASLPSNILEAMRHRAFCSDEADGFMLIPSYAGDFLLGRKLFEEIDIHDHGSCPLQRWLQEELSAFAPVAEQHFGWSEASLRNEIKLECIGGKIGIEPDLCMSVPDGDGFRIIIGHVFYHVMLVAARSCAARIRLSEDEPRNNITAKEINDSLRQIIALYDGSRAVPATDAIAAKLLPHQVLIVERLAKGLRRFVIAHEMGHLLLWKTDGKFKDFEMPWRTLEEFGRIAKAPSHRVTAWADEFACDMMGIKLMQETSLTESNADNEFSPQSHLPLMWDFAAVQLWMTMWDHILHRMKLSGQPVSDTHPPPQVRMIALELSYPRWLQSFGKQLSQMFSYRMEHL